MSNSQYILDANVFIEAARRYYAFDLAPGFWAALETHAKAGTICSIDRVGAELYRGKDDLAKWIKSRFKSALATTDVPSVVASFTEMVGWVSAQTQFMDGAKTEFATVADGWIVAHAKVNGACVVSHEVYQPAARRRVPIPNVCIQFDVPCIDTFELLRRLKVSLK